MRCDDVRLSLSARLDGEATPLPAAEVDKHLTACPGCRAWLATAQRVTRVVRVQAVDVPDLTERILAAARDEGALPPTGRTPPPAVRIRGGVRGALGLLAVVQLLLAVPRLLGAVGHDLHAGREVAAFDIALAVGLLVVACYPEYAKVFAPVVVTLVVCFAAASGMDILQGVVTPGDVAIHALSVAQAGLVWVLARTARSRPAVA